MSKIQAMFSARGRRLFGSERPEIDELNADYTIVGTPTVSGMRHGTVVSDNVACLQGYRLIAHHDVEKNGLVCLVRLDQNRSKVVVVSERSGQTKNVVYKDAQSGLLVKPNTKKRPRRQTVTSAK